MAVPFYDHAKLYRQLKAEIDAAIHRVLDSGRLGTMRWPTPGLKLNFG